MIYTRNGQMMICKSSSIDTFSEQPMTGSRRLECDTAYLASTATVL